MICTQVIRAALADSNLAVSQWRGAEMHGTGTALGDPIEIGAIVAVASRSRAGAVTSPKLALSVCHMGGCQQACHTAKALCVVVIMVA